MPLYFLNSNEEFLSLSTKNIDKCMGGHVIFRGSVRGINHESEVDHLFYEAYQSLAFTMWNKLEEEIRRRFHVNEAFAFHRVGRVEVSHDAVVITASAKHRHEAFLAVRFLIDELKRRLPIWKKEVYKTGASSWNQDHCRDLSSERKMMPVMKALLAKGIALDMLKNKRVLLVGAGGLGCPLAINLMAFPLKKLCIYDGDRVCESNLFRQFIYEDCDRGAFKAQVIKKFLEARHPHLVIDAQPVFLEKDEAYRIANDYDLIIDATDQKNTKTMLKEIAWAKKVSLISASVYQLEGEVQSFSKSSQACLACFSPTNDEFFNEGCEDYGVLTHVCAMVASVATEKMLLMLCENTKNSDITIVDPRGFIKTVLIEKDQYCRVCGDAKQYQRKKLVRLSR